jgi:hypothetical protein
MNQFVCDAARDGLCNAESCPHKEPHCLDIDVCCGSFLCDHVPDAVQTVTCHAIEVKVCDGCRHK